MTRRIAKRYIVNYDTKWTHILLKHEQALYFKAKTPIQDIILQLENSINKNEPKHLHKNYQKERYTISNFSRLYRNLVKSYLGWKVYYRKSRSLEDYSLIPEKIGYKKIVRNKRSLKNILSNRVTFVNIVFKSTPNFVCISKKVII